MFSGAMVIFASVAILYDTSIRHHDSTHHSVAASLERLAAVALLFGDVLRIVMAMASRRWGKLNV
jgi:hypothetical protein